MECRIDLNEKPQPLDVRLGDGQGFRVFHDYLDAGERAAALEALENPTLGLAIAMAMLWRKITAWEGVKDMAGNPIALKRIDAEGKETSNFPAVMGRARWVDQLRLMVSQLALNGVTLARTRRAFESYVSDDGELESIMQGFEVFTKRRGAAGTSSSPASGSTAGSPASSV